MKTRFSKVRWLGALLVLTAFALTLPPAAHAMTLTVTDSGDSGLNTLRGKIASASSGDTIVFDLPSCPCVIDLTTGALAISKNLTITGPGAATLAIDAHGASQVFTIGSGTVHISNLTIRHGSGTWGGNVEIQNATVTLDHVVVSGGKATSGGGNVRSAFATLTLDQVVVTGGTTPGAGGGILNGGTLVMTNSMVTNNTSTYGGGLYISSGSSVTLTGVTISGNKANQASYSDAGGLRADSGTFTLTNVTISGNSANGGGGGITDNGGVLNLVNVTIANNTAGPDGGGGIWALMGTTNITNTILAGNTSPTGPDCDGTVDSYGYNLIQSTTNCTISGTTTGNVTGSNPQLAALADNGGPTQTMALGASSPAINAANPAVCAAAVGSPTFGAGGLDQRGFARRTTSTPQFCDMGAFEAQPATLNVVAGSSPQSALVNAAFALPLKANVKDANANALGGAVVSFAAPVSGASAVLSSGTATSNSSGNASVTATANHLAGSYSITATTPGATSATFNLTNTAYSTTTTISTHSPNPSHAGQPVTIAFTVTSPNGSPTGNVTVGDGTLHCTATVAVGSCQLTFTSPGTKTLTASYAGDGTFAASTSGSVTHTVLNWVLYLPLTLR